MARSTRARRSARILEEPLKIHHRRMHAGERRKAALAMMARVGLRSEHYDRYPHMFSGGQRQRIAIARSLMLNPRLLVLDEPVSALDLSVQAQVLNILSELQEEFGLAYLFISHALSVVRHMADTVLVMYLGRPVEYGPREEIFRNPRHPYTRALLSATPIADPTRPKERIKLEGELPSPINPPSGCPFHPRCPLAFERCSVDRPDLATKGPMAVACWAVDAAGNVDWTKAARPGGRVGPSGSVRRDRQAGVPGRRSRPAPGEEVDEAAHLRRNVARRRVDRIDAAEAERRRVEMDADEPSGAEVLGDEEGGLVDQALSGKRRGPQRVAVVGAEVAVHRDRDRPSAPKSQRPALAAVGSV